MVGRAVARGGGLVAAPVVTLSVPLGRPVLRVIASARFPIPRGCTGACRGGGVGSRHRVGSVGRHADLGALAQPIRAVHHDLVPGFQTVQHLQVVAIDHAGLDDRNADRVVRLDEVDEASRRTMLHGRHGCPDDPVQCLQEQPALTN